MTVFIKVWCYDPGSGCLARVEGKSTYTIVSTGVGGKHMQSLPKIRAAIEKELTLFPKALCDQFGDDSFVRLSHEEELLKRLLTVTEEFIQEQAGLESRLEAYI
jgi:hypothetical protein